MQNRLARLEKDGTVLGYTVRLKASAEISAFALIFSKLRRTV